MGLNRHTDKNWLLPTIAQIPSIAVVFFLLGHSLTYTQQLDDYDTRSRLVDSAISGNLDEVKSLVRRGVWVDTHHDFKNIRPLYGAALNGHLKVVKYLVRRGAQIDFLESSNCDTPLTAATRMGHLKVAKYLIQ